MSRQHPAFQRWADTRRTGTLEVVSSFYESATRALVGGETPIDKQDGDVVLPDYSALIEVKGATGSNVFPIRWRQFEELERRAEQFPFDGAPGYYFLWSYCARESRNDVENPAHRRSLIRDKVVVGQGFEFLAERTRHLWIVPLSLIRETYGKVMDDASREEGVLFPPTDDGKAKYGIRMRRRELLALEHRQGAAHGAGVVTHHPNGNGGYATAFKVAFIPHNGTPRPKLRNVEWQ